MLVVLRLHTRFKFSGNFIQLVVASPCITVRQTKPDWICCREFCLEPKAAAAGEARIFGFYNKKKKSKKQKKMERRTNHERWWHLFKQERLGSGVHTSNTLHAGLYRLRGFATPFQSYSSIICKKLSPGPAR